MAGNALDRTKAKRCIDEAENGLEIVCSRLVDVSTNVRELNNSYAGKNADSIISKVYKDYQALITECMQSFGGSIQHIFIDYHKGLVGLINQGADGDEINPTISAHSKVGELSGVLLGTDQPGIKDYAVTKSKVEALQVSVDKFVAATDDIIASYQSLWWLGDDAGNDAIKGKAHVAAEKVRELIEQYATKFKQINTAFKDTIDENEAQQNLSADELETRANELYKILQSINFNTISADQDALSLISSSWRQYI